MGCVSTRTKAGAVAARRFASSMGMGVMPSSSAGACPAVGFLVSAVVMGMESCTLAWMPAAAELPMGSLVRSMSATTSDMTSLRLRSSGSSAVSAVAALARASSTVPPNALPPPDVAVPSAASSPPWSAAPGFGRALMIASACFRTRSRIACATNVSVVTGGCSSRHPDPPRSRGVVASLVRGAGRWIPQ